MKSIIKVFLTYLIAIIINIFLWNLIVETFIFKSSGGYFDKEIGKRGISYKHSVWSSEGYSNLILDSLGFNNYPYKLEKDPNQKRVVIIGDSFTEAFQVDRDSNFVTLLGKSLGSGYEVLNFGISGATMSDHIYTSNFISKKLDPDIIILEVNTLADFGSENFNPQNWLHIENDKNSYKISSNYSLDKKTKIKNFLYNFSGLSGYAIVRFKELIYSIKRFSSVDNSSNKSFDLQKKKEELENLVSWELSCLKKNYTNIVVISLDNLPIIEDNKFKLPNKSVSRKFEEDLIKSKLLSENIELIEVEKKIMELSLKNRISYIGANNKKVGFGHLNNKGHRVVSKILYDYVKNMFNNLPSERG
ncbi:MAG: hypothetical protein CR982_02995 [Candidatus Cloacimonadota bacterium]|nr:MAG: hypothetical protein CR982_02995 [Candidatus Cloacimonadota bacterium]PIE82031.1 MAG: hypothetical protein CSA15_00185 [Candidatus Delongbacteria bacterium]